MRNVTDNCFVLSDSEVKDLAKKFFPDIKLYVDTHREEFLKFKSSYEVNTF